LAGAAPGPLTVASVKSFQASFGLHSVEIVADLPNDTNTQLTAPLSEIMI